MIRNESTPTFCPGEKPWVDMMLGGYSQDIFHFLPHPFSTKNFNGRLVNDDNLYRVQRHQPGTELQPKEQFICFQRKSFGERKVTVKEDQLESDLGCWKIETRDNSKMRRVRLAQTIDGRGQWLWCGQDLGEEGTPCRADLDCRHPSWLDAEMMTVTERITEDPECQTQDWYMRVR